MINTKKPTPLDEAKNIIYILRNVYYDAVGDLFSYIKSNIENDEFDNYNIIKLGFWPGGDRDGNPFVTAEITNDVADELRTNLMKCYYNDLKILRKKLTFKDLRPELNVLRDRLYVSMFDPEKVVSYDNIIGPLLKTRAILIQKYNSLYLKQLDDLIDKVKIFKTHFATLDIRQDHSKHKQVIETVLKVNGYVNESLDELAEDELTNLLLNENLRLDSKDYKDEILKDTIENNEDCPFECLLLRVTINPAKPLSEHVQLDMDVSELKNKTIILIDDVANTGRTLFYAFKPFMDLLVKKMQVAVLVDRKHKSFPVQVDYVGISLATTICDNIAVNLSLKGKYAAKLN